MRLLSRRLAAAAALALLVGVERAAQVGALVATHVVETVGTQEYAFSADGFLKRFEQAYGADATDELRPHLQA